MLAVVLAEKVMKMGVHLSFGRPEVRCLGFANRRQVQLSWIHIEVCVSTISCVYTQ